MAFFVPETHDCSAQSSTLLEGLKDLHLSCDFNNVDVGDPEVITVSFFEDATGSIKLSIDGQNLSHTITEHDEGKVFFEIQNLTAGTKNFLITYSGDVKYKRSFVSNSFEVTKLTPDMSMTVHADGDAGVISLNFPSDFTGIITVQIDNAEKWTRSAQVLPEDNGHKIFTIPGLSGGDHAVLASYPGDDKYNDVSASSSFDVSDIPLTMNVIASAETINVGGSVTYTVTMPEDCKGDVQLEIDGVGVIETKSTADGTVQFTLSGFDAPPGNYVVIFTCWGDDKYAMSSVSKNLEVQ